jgi:23S rRNA (cytosine1962-C5)-methyltransferase
MDSYRLLDSGDFEKLEQIGEYKLIRPSLGSAYKKAKPEQWKAVDAHYKKNDKGSGSWTFHKKIPEAFFIKLNNFRVKIKLTPFGHIGIFPEQEKNWDLIQSLGKIKNDFEVLNLFAYSGLSTLAAINVDYSICHVDSSKGMISWAKENAEASNLLEKKIRWIEDDVLKFLKREVKRGKVYKGFILDPPTFGRGANGEIWKIESDLLPLLEEIMNLCKSKPEFIILSCHSSGFSPLTLSRILESLIKVSGKFYATELSIPEASGKSLPCGFSSYFLGDSFSNINPLNC